jgi:hypothetical protein
MTPYMAARYAVELVKGPWPEGEWAIMKGPVAAVYYAMHAKGRWPEAEPSIMRDPLAAVTYAARVIKGRWPEAEHMIRLHYGALAEYRDNLRKRWLSTDLVWVGDTPAFRAWSRRYRVVQELSYREARR